MISGIILFSEKGHHLLSRFYRDNISKNAIEVFRSRIIQAKKFGKPIVKFGKTSFLYHREGDVFVVAATRQNVNTAMVFQFIFNLIKIFKDYFKKFDATHVKDNFCVIYELLDEVMDNGFPQITSSLQLQRYIKTGDAKIRSSKSSVENDAKVADDITGRVDWREPGIMKTKNEVFIDVLEAINLLASANKDHLRKDVSGKIMMRANLSGMPECKFGMNDKLMLESESKDTSRRAPRKTPGIAIDDVQFHRCVQLHAFESDRTISFVPPDEEFELMRYRVTNTVNLPFTIGHAITERKDEITYNINITAVFSYKITAKDVILMIPTPQDAAKCTFQKNVQGKAKWNTGRHAIFWKIKKFPGDASFTLNATVKRLTGVNQSQWSRPPITVDFQVGKAASGLAIRFLKVLENKLNYETVKWVRYMTRAGQYQLRI